MDELDDDLSEIFTHHLDANGIAISTVSNGVVMGISKEKLEELLEIARENEDGRIIIFVSRKSMPDDKLN